MHTHLGVPEGQQEAVWRPLFQKYNQSLRALRAGGFDIQQEEYWDRLRAGAEHYLRPDPQVGQRLLPPLRAVQSAVSAGCLQCNAAHLSEGVHILCRWLAVTVHFATSVTEACNSQEKTRARWPCIKRACTAKLYKRQAGEGTAGEPTAGEVGLHQLQ